MNVDFLCSTILSSSFGLSMGSIWQHLSMELCKLETGNEERTAIFLEVLRRLMLGGHLKLGSNGKFLSGDVDEQIDALRSAWPICPEEDDLDGFGFWFLTTAPAGVVWLTAEGQEVWT
ncbi:MULTISPECIES: DUF596 domain-containing protein [Pseudomonas]|uniref:DUF596 domain-containing protein n=1 Tax=Pseudomonas frederiksbergensis TaxID=104087 RepID=A0A0B1Z123_9PSED|nr:MULTISPECIES: DUF596 domain-containing protein [Pseudomonas]KHK62961.1 hypothetical protein JZ00_20890 [Pseudomonas frederiksbergensis]KJH87250.1 hypothetical protein UG46_07430 [Pseudomonas fluorescens]WRV66986.1 DUF596 domain-containing protein [Pseudomonas frederiksbergensis]